MAKRKSVYLVLVSVLIFGAIGITIAYAATNSNNTATNVVTVGNVKIILHNQDDEEVNSHKKKVMPGDKISKIVSVENVGDYAAYIRVKVKREWLNNSVVKPLSVDAIVPTIREGWNIGSGEDSEYVYYYYNRIVSATENAIPFMSDYLLDAASIDNDTLDANVNAQGKITIEAEAVQADYYTPEKRDGYIIGWPDVSFGTDYVNNTPVATVVTQPAISSGSSVEFVGNSDQFVSFETGTDLFLNVKGLMPGQTVEQDIFIKNIYDNPVEVYLYAKIPDDVMVIARSNTQWDLLRTLQLVVTSSAIGSNGQTIYQGPLFDKDDSKDMLSQEKAVLLGTFEKERKYKIQAAITLPGSWKKSYCQTKVDWVFTTKRIAASQIPIPTNAPGNVVQPPTPTMSVLPTIEVIPTKTPFLNTSMPEPTESPEVVSTIEPTPKKTIEPEETPILGSKPSGTTEPWIPTTKPSSTYFTPIPTYFEEETMVPMETPVKDPIHGSTGATKEPTIYTPIPTPHQINGTVIPTKTKKPQVTNISEETPKPNKNPDIPEEHATKTGDETPILFWIIVGLVSFLGVMYNSIVLTEYRNPPSSKCEKH